MKKAALAALVACTAAGASPGVSEVPTGTEELVDEALSNIATKNRKTTCPYARLGVAHYRGRYVHWQLQRGASLPTWRKPRTCADARYLANVWAKRAQASRTKTIKHFAAIKARKARQAALERQHPKWIALRLLGGDRRQWSCLINITWWENRTMDPTLDFGGGHGNTSEAYGIPQAKPGYKMASAGPDWATNTETQLRWMIGYCRARYGSVCGAWYHRQTAKWY